MLYRFTDQIFWTCPCTLTSNRNDTTGTYTHLQKKHHHRHIHSPPKEKAPQAQRWWWPQRGWWGIWCSENAAGSTELWGATCGDKSKHTSTNAVSISSCKQNRISADQGFGTSGHRSFCPCAAPSVWNSLPHEIRYIQSTTVFKTALKTHQFKTIYYYC